MSLLKQLASARACILLGTILSGDDAATAAEQQTPGNKSAAVKREQAGARCRRPRWSGRSRHGSWPWTSVSW